MTTIRSAAGLFLLLSGVACAKPVLTAEDAVRFSSGKTRFIAHVESEPILGLRRDREGVAVEFLLDDEPIGRDRTNDDGRASLKHELQRDTIRQWRAVAHVDGDRLTATARVFNWDRDRVILAVDIDQTISETEYSELIFEKRDEESDPIDDARSTLRALARDYHIAYVTARPRFLLEKTREWLEANKFPAEPVVSSPGLRATARPGRYKRAALAELRDDWTNLLIGIGNTVEDADAYGANKMLALILVWEPDESRSAGSHAIVFHKWKHVRRFFEANHEVLIRPNRVRKIVSGNEPLRVWLPPYGGDNDDD